MYWNATGNGWIFPIHIAEARIRRPRAPSYGERSVYTGPQGSPAANGEVVNEAPGDILFRTTQPLNAYEGLTVAAAFPKGVVDPPSSGQRLLWWLRDYGPPIFGVACLLGLLFFYYTAWKRVGRDPRPGTVVPIFSPPDDLAPGAMRYVQKIGTDDRSFAAALVDLGVRGHLRLVQEDGGWFGNDRTRIERLASSEPTPAEEAAVLDGLVTERVDHDDAGQSQHLRRGARAAQRAVERAVRRQAVQAQHRLGRRRARADRRAVWLVLVANGLFSGAAPTAFALACAGALALAAIIFGLTPSSRTCATNALIGVMIVIAVLASGPVIAAGMMTSPPLGALILLLAIPLAASVFFWISAPTAEGRTVVDHIARFKQYLSIAEAERLDRMTAPKDTPELFEKYLPYAIALGVENRWADRFRDRLAAAAAQGQQGFAWYSGSSKPWDNPASFADAVGSSQSSTISAASTAPGSSSGSGGGGFSGGGGGGGGGGGW